MNPTVFRNHWIFYPLLYFLFAFPVSSRSSSAKNLNYPDTYGVFILDKGVFTRLTDDSPGADIEDLKHRTFSKDLRILVFEKWMAHSQENNNTVAIFDWRSIDERPMIQVSAVSKPVDDQKDMLMIVPNEKLKPSLYTVEIGNRSHEYHFGVETPDVAGFWKAVLEERPKSWQAHNHLGAIMFMSGDVKDALSHFLAAVHLNPNNPESRTNLGLAFGQLGQPESAIEQFEAAVKMLADSAVYTDLANAYLQVKRYDDAIKAYRHAVQLNPTNTSAHCNLGYVLMQQGKVDDAIAEFRKTVELDPNMSQGQADLKEALKRKGDRP